MNAMNTTVKQFVVALALTAVVLPHLALAGSQAAHEMSATRQRVDNLPFDQSPHLNCLKLLPSCRRGPRSEGAR